MKKPSKAASLPLKTYFRVTVRPEHADTMRTILTGAGAAIISDVHDNSEKEAVRAWRPELAEKMRDADWYFGVSAPVPGLIQLMLKLEAVRGRGSLQGLGLTITEAPAAEIEKGR